MAHWNGTTWELPALFSLVASGTELPLAGVFSSSASSAWAVGDDGLVLEWNGSAWSVRQSGTLADFASVWAAPSGDVWVVGGNAILHRAP